MFLKLVCRLTYRTVKTKTDTVQKSCFNTVDRNYGKVLEVRSYIHKLAAKRADVTKEVVTCTRLNNVYRARKFKSVCIVCKAADCSVATAKKYLVVFSKCGDKFLDVNVKKIDLYTRSQPREGSMT